MKHRFIYFALLLSIFFLFACNEGKQNQKEEIVYAYYLSNTSLNGETYVVVDDLEFFMGDEAVAEAKKDGNAEFFLEENGDTSFFVFDDYYIRDLDDSTKTEYLISEEAKFFLVNFGENTIGSDSVNCEKFLSEMQEYDLLKMSVIGNTLMRVEEIFVP